MRHGVAKLSYDSINPTDEVPFFATTPPLQSPLLQMEKTALRIPFAMPVLRRKKVHCKVNGSSAKLR